MFSKNKKKSSNDEGVPLDRSFTLKEGFEIQNRNLKILLAIFLIGSVIERTAVALTPTFLYIRSGEIISKTMPIESFCEQVIISFKEKHYNSIVIDPAIKSALTAALENDPVRYEKIESLVVSKELKICKVVVRDELGLRGFVLSYEIDSRKENPFIYKLTDASEELITSRNIEE